MTDLDDPDDAYDATDPVAARLVNVDHRLAYVAVRLRADDEPFDHAELAARIRRVRDDLATIRAELT